MIPPPPISTLFPYTTLSDLARGDDRRQVIGADQGYRDLLRHQRTAVVLDRDDIDLDNSGALVTQEVTVTLRSEEHMSELQSPDHLVCRLLLEKKNKMYTKKC